MRQMTRIVVHDHTDAYLCEIVPSQVMALAYTEELNGEHSLTIKTTQELQKTDRLLVQDSMGEWHEYVVLGITSTHKDGGGAVITEYYCTWSLMYDLSATYIDTQVGLVPGKESVPNPAREGLAAALSGTGRWTIGTVTVTVQSSASFYRRSGWDGIQQVIDRWGGEVGATITVSRQGVVTRQVDLLAHTGTTEATRRFDYGHDVAGIKRTISDDVWPCRIVPLGRSVETEAGGYTRRPTIADANGGVVWLQDDDMVPYTRIPDGQGGWEYPTAIVKNDTYEKPEDIKAWGLEHIHEYTKPIVSYEVDVKQYEQAGMHPHGVSLGDETIVVDGTLGDGGLRIAARAIKIQGDLLDPTATKLTLGSRGTSLANQLGSITRGIERLEGQLSSGSEYQNTAAYLSALLGRINGEINATGGYTYITEGQGIRTYDVPVADPTSGLEANSVVEIKGGTIRIANSKTSGGDWDWKTVFTSGHVAAELVTAANLTAGYIGDPTGTTYWDLDNSFLRLVGALSMVVDGYWGGKIYATLGRYGNSLRGLIMNTEGESYGSQVPDDALLLISCSNGSISGTYDGSTRVNYLTSKIMSNTALDITSFDANAGSTHSTYGGQLKMGVNELRLKGGAVSSGRASELYFFNGNVHLNYGSTTAFALTQSTSAASSSARFYGALRARTLEVDSTKNRRVATEDYGEVLLNSYETASPMFGDVGGGVTDETGTCVVPLDPALRQAARFDLGYQVFLQPMADARLWVAEKRADCFVVQGAPGVAFDWHAMARQTGFESIRMEDAARRDALPHDEDGIIAAIEGAHETPEDYARAVEAALEGATA